MASWQHGAPLQTCQWAARRVAALTGVGHAVRSRWFDSAAVPEGSGPRYVNGAMRLEGSFAPPALLTELHRLEAEAGRTRGVANAPRTLDLDIIDMDGCMRAEPDPVLPHPRMHLRAFVLLPLRDVAPRWVHPVTGEAISALIAALPAQDTRAL